jgi:GTPase SAR1 family protein
VLFDVTNSNSFDNLPTWLKEVRSNCGNPNLVYILVGSKGDCVNMRKVSRSKAEKFAAKEGLVYVETSSKANSNIQDTFLQPTRLVWQKIKSEEYTDENPCWPGTGGSKSAPSVLDLNNSPKATKEAKCCK